MTMFLTCWVGLIPPCRLEEGVIKSLFATMSVQRLVCGLSALDSRCWRAIPHEYKPTLMLLHGDFMTSNYNLVLLAPIQCYLFETANTALTIWERNVFVLRSRHRCVKELSAKDFLSIIVIAAPITGRPVSTQIDYSPVGAFLPPLPAC